MKEYKCDLLVAGGGISGMCAAIAAARKGLSVVLVNDRSVLGGNASSEIGVNICGANHGRFNAAIYGKETGIIEEIRLKIEHRRLCGGYGDAALCDAVFFEMIYNEKNINLILNTVVEGCTVSDGRIVKATARHSVSNEVYEIYAQSYVDATGNGVLAYEAGAECRMGRESKAEFNEFWAPEDPDSYTMGNTILFETGDAGHKVDFVPPAFAYDITKMDFLKDIDKPENFRGLSCYGAHWTYEYGGQVDILADHNEIELELRKLIYGIWDYVKNSGKYPEAENRYLKRVYTKSGQRESRRIVGDYILTENDIENKVDFEDSVAIGGWPMDVHAPLGIYDTSPASNFVPVTGIYNIPFRCLYSKDVNNLMMAGRNISVTHIALGSTRVMATCGAIGQAVGTAAYFVKKYNTTPREIYKNHINELRNTLLEEDQAILHVKEETVCATVTATSEKKYENVSHDGYMRLKRDYALAFMADSDVVESIKFKIKSNTQTVLLYKIYSGIHPETFLLENLEKVHKIDVADGFDGWIELPVQIPVGADGKIYLVFKANENIELAISKKRTMGAITYRMHTQESHEGKNHDSIPLDFEKTGYISFDHIYETEKNILFKDIVPFQNVFSAQNVVNGYSRPYKTQNLWLADMVNPQSIIVTLENPIDMKQLSVVFDDRLDIDLLNQIPSTLAKEFTIKITHQSGIEVITENNNCRRIVEYNVDLKAVTTLEIIVNKTYGGEETGIYAIKFK